MNPQARDAVPPHRPNWTVGDVLFAVVSVTMHPIQYAIDRRRWRRVRKDYE